METDKFGAYEVPSEEALQVGLEKIGQSLRLVREEKGVSGYAMAKRMRMHVTGIYKVEAGTAYMTLKNLLKYATALNCEVILELRPKGRAPGEEPSIPLVRDGDY